jgi:hypothetical protein
VRGYGYNPMHKPRKAVTQEDMARVLAKHATPAVKVSVAVECTTANLLGWKPPQRAFDGVYVMISNCERFQIHALPRTKGWTYESLSVAPGWNNVLGFVETKEDAIELCESQARQAKVLEAGRAHPTGQSALDDSGAGR